MKFRVIFLKKKHIIYFFVILILIIILILALVSHKKSVETFGSAVENKTIKTDLTGDGKDDLLYINNKNGKYYINVSTNEKIIPFEPQKSLNTLGTNYTYWPMRVTLMDITKDKVPEIFIQSSENDKPIQHVFKWNNNKFDDILCSQNNLIGFSNYSKKEPVFISGTYSDNNIKLISYVLINNTMQNFNIDNRSNFMGKNTVTKLLNYIQNYSSTGKNKPSDIFAPNISDTYLKNLDKLTAQNNKCIFEDGRFEDTKCDKNGKISEAIWIINFKSENKSQNKNINGYTLTLFLKNYKNQNSNFKIYSINTNQF